MLGERMPRVHAPRRTLLFAVTHALLLFCFACRCCIVSFCTLSVAQEVEKALGDMFNELERQVRVVFVWFFIVMCFVTLSLCACA